MGFLAIQKTKGTYTSLKCALFNSERHQVSMKRHALRMLKHHPPSWILCRNAFEHLVMPVCWQPTCCEEPSYVCMYHRHHRRHRPSWKPWKILADPERTQSMLLESNCADCLLISLVIWSCALFLCSTSPSQCFPYCYRLFSSFSQVRISHAVTMNDEEDFLSPAGQRRKTLRSMTTSNLSLSPTRSFAPTTSPERGKLNRRSDPTLLSSRQSPRKSSKTIMEKVQKFLGLQLANGLRLFKS